ncbi:MAG: Cof-type HAD-IIB family hydrolase [Trueperaceae bacterium]|mgnify:FL=1
MPAPAHFDGTAPRLPSGLTLPRLIAIDIDGTILGPDKLVTPRTRAAIGAVRELGVKVVLATGRPLRTALPIAQEVGATDSVIAYNGAAMSHAGSFRVLGELELGAATEALRRIRTAAPSATLALETDSGWVLDGAAGGGPLEPVGNVAHLFHGGPPTAVGPLEDFIGGSRIKLLAVYDDEHPSRLARVLEGLDLYSTWSLPFLLEVHHAAVDKSAALAELCRLLGVKPEEVAAFGDQHNDAGMLAWAGLGVAMGNSEPEALEAADLVTASNLADGVAMVIESWLRAAPGSHEVAV